MIPLEFLIRVSNALNAALPGLHRNEAQPQDVRDELARISGALEYYINAASKGINVPVKVKP